MATEGISINMGILAGEPKPHISISKALIIVPIIPVGSMGENIEKCGVMLLEFWGIRKTFAFKF